LNGEQGVEVKKIAGNFLKNDYETTWDVEEADEMIDRLTQRLGNVEDYGKDIQDFLKAVDRYEASHLNCIIEKRVVLIDEYYDLMEILCDKKYQCWSKSEIESVTILTKQVLVFNCRDSKNESKSLWSSFYPELEALAKYSIKFRREVDPYCVFLSYNGVPPRLLAAIGAFPPINCPYLLPPPTIIENGVGKVFVFALELHANYFVGYTTSVVPKI